MYPVFHVHLLKLFDPNSGEPTPPTPILINGEPEWPVERILDHLDVPINEKSQRTRRSFLIKWAGFGHEHNSWEPEEHCKNRKDLIQDYYASVQYGADLQQRAE